MEASVRESHKEINTSVYCFKVSALKGIDRMIRRTGTSDLLYDLRSGEIGIHTA